MERLYITETEKVYDMNLGDLIERASKFRELALSKGALEVDIWLGLEWTGYEDAHMEFYFLREENDDEFNTRKRTLEAWEEEVRSNQLKAKARSEKEGELNKMISELKEEVRALRKTY
tara:strand:- start:341 stop:694 length:354 start_codon:yes stop_codon:yes gene_type:complete